MSVKAALFISTILLTVLPSNIRTFVVMDFLSNNGIPKSNENQNPKKDDADDERCPSWKPFSCLNGECISLHYICDGSPDCSNNYDENKRLCTAKRRPPADVTREFLEMLIDRFGADFFAKIFGEKGADKLMGLGGAQAVAVALTESPNIIDFAKQLRLDGAEIDRLVEILYAIVNEDQQTLNVYRLMPNEVRPIKMYAEKLIETGFLKRYLSRNHAF